MVSEDHHHHHHDRNWSSVASTRMYRLSSLEHTKKHSTSVNYPSSVTEHPRVETSEKTWHCEQPEINPFIEFNEEHDDEEEQAEDYELRSKNDVCED